MGCFSYKCNRCGSHGQFDFVDSCVVKIGDNFYRGTYDMYGGVEIAVATETVTDENNPSSAKARTMIMAYHEQFRNLASKDEECLYATKIYCNGGDYGSSVAHQVSRAKHMIQSRDNLLMSPQEPDERNCVPWGALILDAVNDGDIASLPKARELSPKSIGHTDKEENDFIEGKQLDMSV